MVQWGTALIGWILPRLPGIIANLLLFFGKMGAFLLTTVLPKTLGLAGELGLGLVSGFLKSVTGPPGLLEKINGFIDSVLIPGIKQYGPILLKAAGDIAGNFVKGFMDFLGVLPSRVADIIRRAFGTLTSTSARSTSRHLASTSTCPRSNIPGFATGSYDVPFTGTGPDHKGEMIHPGRPREPAPGRHGVRRRGQCDGRSGRRRAGHRGQHRGLPRHGREHPPTVTGAGRDGPVFKSPPKPGRLTSGIRGRGRDGPGHQPLERLHRLRHRGFVGRLLAGWRGRRRLHGYDTRHPGHAGRRPGVRLAGFGRGHGGFPGARREAGQERAPDGPPVQVVRRHDAGRDVVSGRRRGGLGRAPTGTRSDKAEVEWLLTTFCTKGVGTGAAIQSTGVIQRDIDYTGMNLFEALTEASKWLGVKFYVATDMALHWYVAESNSAPFNLSDAPNGTTTFGYDGFSFPDDSLDLCNAVYVIGTDARGRVGPAGSLVANRQHGRLRPQGVGVQGRQPRHVIGPSRPPGCKSSSKYSVPRGPITITVFRPGLRADQNIQITNGTWGMSAVTYRIQEVNSSVNGSSGLFKYQVTLQDAPVTLSNTISGGFDRVDSDVNRSTDNAIGYAEQFLIGRVKVVNVLPPLPDANYPQGSQVLLTIDEKLYRNPDDVAWTAAIWLPDGLGLITTTQIADDAISTPKIQAGSIQGQHIQAGAIDSDQIAANAIQAGHIEAGAIGAQALAAQIVLADTLLTTGLAGRRVEI